MLKKNGERKICAVAGHRRILAEVDALLSRKTVKFIKVECHRDLASAVSPEIEEDNGIFVAHNAFRKTALVHDYGRTDEFVVFTSRVGVEYRIDRRFGAQSEAHRQSVVSLLYPFPAVVAVHRVESAHDCRNFTETFFFHLFVEFTDVIYRALRRSIPAVKKAVNDDFEFVTLSEFKQRIKVFHRAVDPAGRDETHEMERPAVDLKFFDCLFKHRIFKETAVFYRSVYLGEILIDDSACADVRVTYFAVSHLTFRQSDVKSARRELTLRRRSQKFIDIRRFSRFYRIEIAAFPDPEPVEDHEHNFFVFHNSPLINF